MNDLTYSTAAKIAEPVTTEELAALIAQDGLARLMSGARMVVPRTTKPVGPSGKPRSRQRD